MDREEKGKGGDRGDLGEKKENQNWERTNQVSSYTLKYKWVLKSGFFKVQNL